LKAFAPWRLTEIAIPKCELGAFLVYNPLNHVNSRTRREKVADNAFSVVLLKEVKELGCLSIIVAYLGAGGYGYRWSLLLLTKCP
jgi:hypothetical protein